MIIKGGANVGIQTCANLVDLENYCNMSITILSKIGVDTAENEPPKVSMKLGGTKQELHPADEVND